MKKEAVMSWLRSHEQEQIEFLQQMIRIPSVTGNEGPIQEFMAKTLTEMGLAVDLFVPSLEELQKHPAYVAPAQPYEGRPDVVGTLKGAGGGRSLLFNGHIDVIPEGSLDNWQHDPWSADIADGKMYGRGTSDMKSGAAAMTMAIRAIQACGIRLKGDLIVEYVMDEELTGNGTLACVMKGYKADAGICCETSSMCVQPGSIGRIWFTINVKGKAAGIQKHREGVSGIDLGYLVCKAVEEYEALRLMDYLGLNQEEAAAQMGVARTTVQRIYAQARQKLAVFLVEGRPLQIGGGSYALCPQESCRGCGRPCGRCASQDGKEASS